MQAYNFHPRCCTAAKSERNLANPRASPTPKYRALILETTEMTELEYLQPVNVVAECLGLSPRRVRQFCENGDVPRLGRGQVDLTWTLYFHAGSLQVSSLTRKPRDAQTLVALAWLTGLDKDPTAKDIDSFADLFKRNGFTREQALMALGRAEGILEDV